MKRQAAIYFVLVMAGFFLGNWFYANQQSALSEPIKSASTVEKATSSNGSLSVADIVDSVGPAVVYIEADSNSNKPNQQGFFGWKYPQLDEKTTGTGFIIDSNGYILTNQHVLDGAARIKVKLQFKDTSYSAALVGEDYELDLAVLKIDAQSLPTIPLGDSDNIRIGDSVVAIGNPLGLDHTVTTGVISAKGRPVAVEDRNYKNLIQTDAAINPGNSGGPLISMQGRVIAINTAVSTSAQGIGFAIPINTAKSIMEELMTKGKLIRPYLGISMLDINGDLAVQMQISADTRGVIIAQVSASSPASEAGLKPLDILVEIDGNPIKEGSQAQEYIQRQQVGQTVKLGILRNGQFLNISVI